MSAIIQAFKDADLRKKIIFTLIMIIAYRIGAQIPTPGVDYASISAQLRQLTQESGDLYSVINLFSGGALLQLSIFAISIMPYITASIIVQLLTVVIPKFEQLKKEGQTGQAKMTEYTRYLTVALALLQSAGIVALADREQLLGQGIPVLKDEVGIFGLIVMVLIMTSGAVLVMWLGELITEHGIGNGISDILFVGIVSRIPTMILYMIQYAKQSAGYLIGMIVLVIVALALVVFIVWVSNAERRIPIQYAKRMVGRKMYGGQSTNLPMKVNMSGVLPVIFASTLLMFPATIISFLNPAEGSFWLKVEHFFSPTSWSYVILYTLLIVGFGYFYSLIQFNPVEVANNLKKNGGFVMGYRPGKPTSDYLARILSKITFIGSVFLIIIALLPVILGIVTDINGITIGGTSLLIVVGVALEIYQQLEAQIMMRHYKGFLE